MRANQEEHWIRQSQQGNSAAFNHLVLKWERTIYNLVLRMLQDPEESSEVCQEIFLAAFTQIRSFRGQSRFSTWLYRIAGNRCLTRLRKRARHQRFSLDSRDFSRAAQTAIGQEQENAVWRRERNERIARALGRLSLDQRIVVELKIYQEQSFEEIAALLDVPLSTVKSRFYSALKVLKRSLGSLTSQI